MNKAVDILEFSRTPGGAAALTDGQLSEVAGALEGMGSEWSDIILAELVTRLWLYRANPTARLAPAFSSLPPSLADWMRVELPNQQQPEAATPEYFLDAGLTDRCWKGFHRRAGIFHRANGFLLLVGGTRKAGGVILPFKLSNNCGAWDESGREITAWSKRTEQLAASLEAQKGFSVFADLAGREDLVIGGSFMLPFLIATKCNAGAISRLNPFHMVATGEFTENGLAPVCGLAAKREMAEKIGAFLLAPRDNGSTTGTSLTCGKSVEEVIDETNAILNLLQLSVLPSRERFDGRAVQLPTRAPNNNRKTMKETTIFEAVSNEATVALEKWKELRGIVRHAAEAENDTTTFSDMEHIDQSLAEGYEGLLNALRHPQLTLAVAGTTSSGKSSFLNFLLGRAVLPVDVRPMTYGTTLIEHGEKSAMRISDSVIPTPDSADLSDREITDTLKQVFKHYQEQSESGEQVAPPKITLIYPLQGLRTGAHLNIPDFVEIRLLDLPGLESIQDLRNGKVIAGGTSQALGIILYNAAEPDVGKQQLLLEDLAVQVRDLGGSPARFLFVLNRIDEMRANDNWSREEECAFADKLSLKIKQKLSSVLRGYRTAIEELKIVPFSPEAALVAAHLMGPDEELSKRAALQARKDYSHMIGDDFEDSLSLPGAAKQWNPAQRREVGSKIWSESGADIFLSHLRRHIELHLPEIVIPLALEKFWRFQSDAARKVAFNGIQSIIVSASTNYEEKLAELDAKEKKVDAVVNTHQDMLNRLVESVNSILKNESEASSGRGWSFIIEGIYNAMDQIYGGSPEVSAVQNEFRKTMDWIDGVSRIQVKVFESVVEAFDGEEEAFTGLRRLIGVSKASKDSLIKTIRYMRDNLSYKGDTAKNGCTFAEEADVQHSQIEDFKHQIGDLTANLSRIVNEFTKHTVFTERKKIREAVDFLLQWHINAISREAQIVADDFRLTITKLPDNPESEHFELSCVLESNYEVRRFDTYTNKTSYRRPKGVWEWIRHLGGNVKETKSVRKQMREAGIPGVTEGMQKGWYKQLQPFFQEICLEFTRWLASALNRSIEHARVSLRKDIQQYRQRLAANRERQKATFEQVLKHWSPIREKTELWEIMAGAVGGGFMSTADVAGMWRNEKNETITFEHDGTWKREEAGALLVGTWILDSPILWLNDSDSSARQAWIGIAGIHIWPRSNSDNKFQRVQSA